MNVNGVAFREKLHKLTPTGTKVNLAIQCNKYIFIKVSKYIT